MSDISQRALDDVVSDRLVSARDQIARSLQQIGHGNPLGAETQQDRAVARLRAKLDKIPLRKKFDPQELAREIRETAEAIEQPATADAAPQPKAGPESVIGLTYDFVGVSFLSRGRTAADAVARIIFRDGRPQGSGFLVAPGLLLTNQHVIASANVAPGFLVEFDFETDDKGGNKQTTVFEFDARFFVSDPKERLDYALVALGPRFAGSRPPESFGFLPLSAAGDKHMLGEVANIIQHPKGRRKEVVLRENRLVSRWAARLDPRCSTTTGR